jgi:hypothetical protein
LELGVRKWAERQRKKRAFQDILTVKTAFGQNGHVSHKATQGEVIVLDWPTIMICPGNKSVYHFSKAHS